MSLTDPTTPKPWYQSRAVWGGVIAGAAPVAGLLGVQLAPETLGDIADIAAAAGGIVGGGLAIWGRLRANTPIGR